MQDDLKGIPAAQNYWQAYFDKYTFEHEVLATAEDSKSGVAFVFWLDRVSHLLHFPVDSHISELYSHMQAVVLTENTACNSHGFAPTQITSPHASLHGTGC